MLKQTKPIQSNPIQNQWILDSQESQDPKGYNKNKEKKTRTITRDPTKARNRSPHKADGGDTIVVFLQRSLPHYLAKYLAKETND